jgi:hypothetical protein
MCHLCSEERAGLVHSWLVVCPEGKKQEFEQNLDKMRSLALGRETWKIGELAGPLNSSRKSCSGSSWNITGNGKRTKYQGSWRICWPEVETASELLIQKREDVQLLCVRQMVVRWCTCKFVMDRAGTNLPLFYIYKYMYKYIISRGTSPVSFFLKKKSW